MKLIKVGFLLLAAAFVANAAQADYRDFNGNVYHNSCIPYLDNNGCPCSKPIFFPRFVDNCLHKDAPFTDGFSVIPY